MTSLVTLPLDGAVTEEALPSTTASAQIFANAPTRAKVAMLTLRSGGLSVRFDGNTATSSAGQEFGPGRYEFVMRVDGLKRIRAIDSSVYGAPSGYITYFE